MIGVIVATHGKLAEELLNSAAMLVGSGRQMDCACVMPTMNPEEFLAETERKVAALDTGEGIVALVDILGGTPNNTLFRLSKKYNIRIVTGVNLSMVMYCVLERSDGMTADELIAVSYTHLAAKSTVHRVGQWKSRRSSQLRNV